MSGLAAGQSSPLWIAVGTCSDSGVEWVEPSDFDLSVDVDALPKGVRFGRLPGRAQGR